MFNFFALSQERLFCNSIFEKCWGQKFRSWCIKKSCSLPAQVLWSVTIIIHLFVLDYFIFEAFHEEHDFIQFNQLNDAGWILPGQLSSLTPVLPTTCRAPPPPPPSPCSCPCRMPSDEFKNNRRWRVGSQLLTCWLAL